MTRRRHGAYSLLLSRCSRCSRPRAADDDDSATSSSTAGMQRRQRRGILGDICVDGDTVELGFLNSTSGVMAISEQTVRDSLMLAAEEINAAGGILGKQIEFIEEDGQSEPTDLRREDQQAAHRGQGRRRVRRLDLGLPQGDAAGGRRSQRPAVLPGAVRGSRSLEEHLLHGRDDQPADHPGHGLPEVEGREDAVPRRVRLRVPPYREQDHQAVRQGARHRDRR